MWTLHAAMRLVFIFTATIIMGILALFILGHLGRQQSFAPPHHPWASQSFLLIIKDKCEPSEISNSESAQPDAIYEIKVALSSDFIWQVQCATNYPLSDLLARLPRASLLFDIQGKSNLEISALTKILGQIQTNPSVGVMSSSHVVSKLLRKEFPQWLFGADPTTLVKARFFTSLFIESMADLWPDFVIIQAQSRASEKLHPRLIEELRRRKKIILWADDGSDAPISSALRSQINGVLTNRPTWVNQNFRN